MAGLLFSSKCAACRRSRCHARCWRSAHGSETDGSCSICRIPSNAYSSSTCTWTSRRPSLQPQLGGLTPLPSNHWPVKQGLDLDRTALPAPPQSRHQGTDASKCTWLYSTSHQSSYACASTKALCETPASHQARTRLSNAALLKATASTTVSTSTITIVTRPTTALNRLASAPVCSSGLALAHRARKRVSTPIQQDLHKPTAQEWPLCSRQ